MKLNLRPAPSRPRSTGFLAALKMKMSPPEEHLLQRITEDATLEGSR